ncbi:MAG: hypothetical protein OEW39_09350 [Deltaproteobacteria bacterium]|nr:hypothetical protein [Deltaproteobacteria bacterium]
MANQGWNRFLTIIEDLSVSESVDKLSRRGRFSDAWDGLKWMLSREGTTLGYFFADGDMVFRHYKQAGDKLAGTPAIAIVYSYKLENPAEITIHELWTS